MHDRSLSPKLHHFKGVMNEFSVSPYIPLTQVTSNNQSRSLSPALSNNNLSPKRSRDNSPEVSHSNKGDCLRAKIDNMSKLFRAG